jgi:mannose-6-phosphate isomerase-like protein (cupin superfamily)
MNSGIRRPQPEDEYYFKEGCHILELSNAPDDPEASIARARVAPGVTTRLHRLDGITERYVILRGSGQVRLDGRAAQEVGPGDVVLIPPRCPQQITNVGDSDLIFLAICTPRFTPGAYEMIEGYRFRVKKSTVTDRFGQAGSIITAILPPRLLA